MSHPNKNFPERVFWRNAVAAINLLEIRDLWVLKYAISWPDPVITFGFCFAQHISRALRENGYTCFDGESGPAALLFR